MTYPGTILALDDKRIDFEKYLVALRNEGIRVKLFTDVDTLVDTLQSVPENLDVPIEYCGLSLDLRVSGHSSAPRNQFGGEWVLSELLQAPNEHLNDGQVERLSSLPVTVLTMYDGDERLKRHRGGKTSIISKSKRDSVPLYVAWGIQAAARHSALLRYQDAGMALCLVLSELSVDRRQISAILKGDNSLGAPPDSIGIWDFFRRSYPGEAGIGPQVIADRWELICRILADACAVFDHNFSAARTYLLHPMDLLGGQSPMDVIQKGSLAQLVEMRKAIDYSWGRS